MSNTFLIAKKEFNDAIKSKLFLVLFLILIFLSATSIIVSSVLFQGKVIDYQNTMQAMKASGQILQISPPQFSPLKLLRGFIDYLEIIGAILGIVLGFYSISKEKNKKTMQLLLSRPIKKSEIISGKILGNLLLITLTVLSVGVISILSLILIGHASISGTEFMKFGIVMVLSIFYILMFFCLSSALSMKMKTIHHALVICFAIWLVFVLILPQIGDTMDPDNQVPGGFFHGMNFNKTMEHQIMGHFGTYETIRNDIEVMSVTKHYERASFGMLGIKDIYNNLPIPDIFSQLWINFLVVLIFLILAIGLDYYIIYRKEVYN
jgi:ABC-2 type transport system permease protein